MVGEGVGDNLLVSGEWFAPLFNRSNVFGDKRPFPNSPTIDPLLARENPLGDNIAILCGTWTTDHCSAAKPFHLSHLFWKIGTFEDWQSISLLKLTLRRPCHHLQLDSSHCLVVMLVLRGWIWLVLAFIAFFELQRASLVPEPTNVVIRAPPLTFVDETKGTDVIIVYNGYIYPKRANWLALLSQQLDELNCNGLAKRAKQIYISLTIDHTGEFNRTSAHLARIAVATLQKIHPKASFDLTLENRYEYPAIRNVWDIAQALAPVRAQNTIIIYMHSKGMSHKASDFRGTRMPLERMLFHATFDSWDHVLHMFHKHPSLNKVGAAPSPTGFVWYNMYYARASYVQSLVNPTISSNRYYYEAWLSYLDPHPIWPRIRHIEFVERNVPRPARSSGCADCWSTAQGRKNDTLGVFFNTTNLPLAYMKALQWYTCRERATLPVTAKSVSAVRGH